MKELWRGTNWYFVIVPGDQWRRTVHQTQAIGSGSPNAKPVGSTAEERPHLIPITDAAKAFVATGLGPGAEGQVLIGDEWIPACRFMIAPGATEAEVRKMVEELGPETDAAIEQLTAAASAS